jgi:hypothetical protein
MSVTLGMRYLSAVLLVLSAFDASSVELNRSTDDDLIGIQDEDDRFKEQSYPHGEKARIYRGVGAIQCTDESKSPESRLSGSTASLVVSNKLVITAAHTLLNDDGSTKFSLDKCSFRIYSDEGKIARYEQKELRSQLVKLWPRSRSNFDHVNKETDWVIAELKDRIPGVFKLGLRMHTPARNEPFRVCQFNLDLPDKTVKRCMEGVIRNFGTENSQNNPNLVIHDVDTWAGGSGAPLVSLDDDTHIYGMIIEVYAGSKNMKYDVNQRFVTALLLTQDFMDTFGAALREVEGR